jgi:Spy/CpxP family protein refolding chaperone
LIRINTRASHRPSIRSILEIDEGAVMKRMLIGMGVAASVLVAGVVAAQTYGMGPGMMNGYGVGASTGMGPGMMAGAGGYGMGPGMMGSFGGDAYAGLDLTPEQRGKIAEIQQATAKAQWQLMGTMHEQGYRMYGNAGPGAFDEAAARKSFDAMSETRKAMFEMQVDARKKVDAVLTPQQREQVRKYWSTR